MCAWCNRSLNCSIKCHWSIVVKLDEPQSQNLDQRGLFFFSDVDQLQLENVLEVVLESCLFHLLAGLPIFMRTVAYYEGVVSLFTETFIAENDHTHTNHIRLMHVFMKTNPIWNKHVETRRSSALMRPNWTFWLFLAETQHCSSPTRKPALQWSMVVL